MKAKDMFKIAYGGNKNAMSDKILSYGLINPVLAYEISKGESMGSLEDGGLTYAVSFIEAKDNEIKGNNDLFKTFSDLEKAKEYIKTLKLEHKSKIKQLEKYEYEKPIIAELKNLIDKTDKKVYSVVKNVSANGMYRHITFFIVINNEVISLDNDIIKLGLADDKKGVCGVGGCGMDMCFSVVYNLGKKICPKTDGSYLLKSCNL